MKLALATPHRHSVHALFAESLANTFRAYPDAIWIKGACSDVSIGRSLALEEFLKSDASVLLWADSDQAWELSDLECVLAPIKAVRAKISGAVIPYKLPGPPKYAVSFDKEDTDPSHGYVGPVYDVGALPGEPMQYGRCRRIGCGFTAVTRSALKAGLEYAPKHKGGASLYFPRIVDGEPRGEDYAACEVFRLAGIEIWFSFDAAVKHLAEGSVYGGSPPQIHQFVQRGFR